MKNNYKNLINLTNIFLIILMFIGVYLSFIGGYGSDEDTLALIGAYESMMGGGKLWPLALHLIQSLKLELVFYPINLEVLQQI